MIAVVACGAAKVSHQARACDLYTGQHFTLSKRAAGAVAERWFILSAKHGLICPFRRIDPYNVTLSGPGAVTAARVREQARELGLEGETVVALAGRAYADLLAGVFGNVRRPLAGLGIGQQRAVLARICRDGRLPS